MSWRILCGPRSGTGSRCSWCGPAALAHLDAAEIQDLNPTPDPRIRTTGQQKSLSYLCAHRNLTSHAKQMFSEVKATEELCSWTGLKNLAANLFFILLSAFYNYPSCDGRHLNHLVAAGTMAAADVSVLLGANPRARARVFSSSPGHGWSRQVLLLGEGELAFVTTMWAVDFQAKHCFHGRPWDLRHSLAFLIRYSTSNFWSITAVFRFTFKERIWLISALKFRQYWLLENSGAGTSLVAQ